MHCHLISMPLCNAAELAAHTKKTTRKFEGGCQQGCEQGMITTHATQLKVIRSGLMSQCGKVSFPKTRQTTTM